MPCCIALVSAGPVLRCNDTEDARARVLDSEELITYLQRRAQQAVDSRDDTSEHLRHVSSHSCQGTAAKGCSPWQRRMSCLLVDASACVICHVYC